MLLDGLPYRHFRDIHADVPWSFETWSAGGEERSAQNHYACMSLSDIARLDVGAHAARDANLWFWVTGPFLAKGAHVPIMRAWGFEPVAVGFVWLKLNASWHPRWLCYIEEAMWFMGLGHTTRQNAEYVILGRRGDPQRRSKAVRQIIAAPLREHSRKPDEVYQRIEQYSEGPYLDLFGRQSRKNWEVRGMEATKFDVNEGQRNWATGAEMVTDQS
jgi:N6-adenosine-specific RNA methylase IME4